jgi:hypothetical protein
MSLIIDPNQPQQSLEERIFFLEKTQIEEKETLQKVLNEIINKINQLGHNSNSFMVAFEGLGVKISRTIEENK